MSNNGVRYSSRLAAVLTLIGMAVGLGNVWRFPYMMGSYGGSAFFAIYIVFTLVFALPALMGEMALGRSSRAGVIVSFRKAMGPRIGGVIGWLLMGTIVIAGSYYAVVIANLLFTTLHSFTVGFEHARDLDLYRKGLSNGWLQYGITAGVIILSYIIVDLGLRKGIERISKFAMPFFLVAIVYLIIHSLTLPGAIPQLKEFLRPDFGAMTAKDVFAALGQAFFSLGLGGTFVVVYGSYIRDSANIPKLASLTALGDVGASFLVSLFLVPTMLVLGLNLGTGPQLIFETLPAMFATMPMGRLVGTVFLMALLAVALLSLIAAYQVPFLSISQLGIKKLTRRKIVTTLCILQIVLSLPSALRPELIGFLDLIFGSGMQVLGSGFALLGITWGLGRSELKKQLFGGASTRALAFVNVWLKWVVPITLLAVLIGYVISII